MTSYPRTAALAARLEVREASASTNADLRMHASDASNWPHLSVLLTTNQTAGRGRLDRTWQTPPGSALAISVLLRELPDPAHRGWIPLLAGVAMADAVGSLLPGHEVGVKWPNDVLVDGRKISGILAEVEGDAIIVGVGVNTAMTAEQLPVPTATSFAVLGEPHDDDAIVAGFVQRLSELLGRLRSADAAMADLAGIVADRCVTLGQRVRVSLPGGDTLEGQASRLDEDGRLVVDSGGALTVVGAGDIVHVRPA